MSEEGGKSGWRGAWPRWIRARKDRLGGGRGGYEAGRWSIHGDAIGRVD